MPPCVFLTILLLSHQDVLLEQFSCPGGVIVFLSVVAKWHRYPLSSPLPNTFVVLVVGGFLKFIFVCSLISTPTPLRVITQVTS